MVALVRFVGRRILRRLGNRSKWLSRALVVIGAVRWLGNRPRSRRVVSLAKGETLVVGLQRRENGAG